VHGTNAILVNALIWVC